MSSEIDTRFYDAVVVRIAETRNRTGNGHADGVGSLEHGGTTMQQQPVKTEIEQAVTRGTVYVYTVEGSTVDTAAQHLTITAPSGLNVGERARVYCRVYGGAAGCQAKVNTGVTASSGSAVTGRCLNGNTAVGTAPSVVSGATISGAGTTVMTEGVGPGAVDLPPFELAAGAKAAFQAVNNSGGTTRCSVRLLVELV